MKKIMQHIWVILFFIILVFVINKIPEWYIISGGDFYQLINIDENIYRYLFTWFNHSGQGQYNPLITTYPFYAIQQLLIHIGFTYSQVSSFLIFQFLIGSFYSFYLSIKWFFPVFRYRFLWSFIYSLNLMVFAILFYPWIVTHHFLIYIFIPLLIGSFYYYLQDQQYFGRSLVIALIIFIVSLPAYNNIAFLVALLFFEGILGLLYVVSHWKNWILKPISKLFIIFSIFVISSLVVILPFLFGLWWYAGSVNWTKAFWWDAVTNFLQATSWTILNSFRLIIDEWRFPHDSLDVKFQQTHNIFLSLASLGSFFLILVIIAWLLFSKKKKLIHNKSFLLFFGVYIFIILLSVRLNPPFEEFNLFFYKHLTVGIFRSPDKVFVFLPFFSVIILLYAINSLKINRTITVLVIVGWLSSILFALQGGIIQQYQYITNGYIQWLIKIPDEYREARTIINADKSMTSVLSLPYSVINSLNWSNYPSWSYIGHDLLHLLYNKPYISANSYDHVNSETTLSLQRFSEKETSIAEMVSIIQKFGTQFIMVHKDVDKQFIGLADHNIHALQDSGIISMVTSNSYFVLYRVNSHYILPAFNVDSGKFSKINPVRYALQINQIGSQESIVFRQSHNPQWKLYLEPYEPLQCDTSASVYSGTTMPYQIGTGTYIVQSMDTFEKISDSITGSTLSGILDLNPDVRDEDLKIGDAIVVPVFSTPESYHVTECPSENTFYAGWELSKLWQKPIFEDTHTMVYDYANQWTIDPEYIKANYPKEYYHENPDGSIDVRMTLYFKPQSYFYLGLIISGTTLLVLIGYLGYDTIRRRKNKNQTP